MDAMLVKKKTIESMTKLYCQHKHQDSSKKGLCTACQTFLTYAIDRLEKCPNENKMNCRSCTKHCYNTHMQNYVKVIMRHSGKHMLYHHPLLTSRYIYSKVKTSGIREHKMSLF